MSSTTPPSPPPPPPPPRQPPHTHIRLATPQDIPLIYNFAHQMSLFWNLTQDFKATHSSLSSTLFNSPPYTSVTIFLLEVSSTTITDSEASMFTSSEGGLVAGLVVFFPNYSTLWGNFGFYVREVFVRECYRRLGFGKMLMKAVAKQAVIMGYERLEWVVLESDVGAIKFYENIGAIVVKEWQKYQISGDSLHSFVQSD